jgi:large subunit ribosomal protein L9
MKVILLQNIKGFGKIGEVKSVSDGHARNFLFPRKLAKPADAGSMKEVDALQKRQAAMNAKDKENAKRAAEAINGKTIEFAKKASPTGTLFSSVSKHEVAKELSKVSSVHLETDMIDLGEQGEHIKHLGEHKITVDLGELSANATVSIKSGN